MLATNFRKKKIISFLIENAITPKDENLVDDLFEGVFVLSKELAFSVLIAETNTMLINK